MARLRICGVDEVRRGSLKILLLDVRLFLFESCGERELIS